MIPEYLARYIDPADTRHISKLAILRDYLNDIRKYADHHPEPEQLRVEMSRIKSLAEECLELCK